MLTSRILAACAALIAAASALAATPAASLDDARRLALENDMLTRRVELASGKEFYFVLDPSAARLTLFLAAAELSRYPVMGLEVADPRVAFVARGESTRWQNRIWKAGTLAPARIEDRIEIKVPTPGSDAPQEATPVPLTPEEAHPVPPRYGIRYEGGLFVEVRAHGDEDSSSMGARLGAWWQDFKDALRREPTDQIRLRLTLQAEDAKAIYRSLPPATKLLVLPPR